MSTEAIPIQGGPEKTERDTSHNMWKQKLVSVYEVTSPEKNDTKIRNFGSVICFLGHILWHNVEAPKFQFLA